MLLPKANRTAIYTFLFKEGVCCCKKDTTSQHDQIPVPNLHVMKLMLSLKSRNFVVEKFNWQWYYYTLTTEGIDYLRSYLHLDSDTVPATHKKENKVKPTPSFAQQSGSTRRFDDDQSGRRGRGRGGAAGGRDGYRGPRTEEGAPRDFDNSFRGGRGGRGGARGGRGRGGFGGGFGDRKPADVEQ